jgi:hypothetical protein
MSGNSKQQLDETTPTRGRPDWLDPDDVGVSPAETAKILNVEKTTLAAWRSQGRGPRYRKSGRVVEYTPKFIREFQQSCVREPEPAAVRRRQRNAVNAATPNRLR